MVLGDCCHLKHSSLGLWEYMTVVDISSPSLDQFITHKLQNEHKHMQSHASGMQSVQNKSCVCHVGLLPVRQDLPIGSLAG
jgi:hypothetical protein